MPEIRHSPLPHGTKISLMEGEAALGGLEVWNLRMRIGDVPVRMGGIGGVYTDRRHRSQGHARRVLEDSVAFMRQEGYHLAALFGIPNFYPKFGFTTALVQSEATIATRDLEDAPACFAVREARPEDAGGIAVLYETMTAARSGAVVRDPATWPGFVIGSDWSEQVSAFVALDGDEVIAYAAYNSEPWRYAITEAGYRDRRAFSTLLAEAGRRALALRIERVTFRLPPDDALLVYGRRYGIEVKTTYPRHWLGMARIINQTELLGLLEPLFARRLADARGEPWAGTLVLRTDLGTDRVRLGAGGPELAIELPQTLLTQLLLGYRSVADAFFETEARADEAALPVLDALLPAGHPYIWDADRF